MRTALDWTDGGLWERMAEGWRGGLSDGTPCGSGSTIAATAAIRASLPELCAERGIYTLADAGAGDCRWQRMVNWRGTVYRPFDLVPRAPGVTQYDVSAMRLPAVDAILCRHVLIHFDPPRIRATLDLFRLAAPYLIASQYDDGGEFRPDRQYNRTDLRPLLGEPLARLPDASGDLCLWALRLLPPLESPP